MDISIKDLIVQMERPGSGLRGLASQTALGTASTTSFAAFNDLLRSIDLANAAGSSNPAPAPDPAPAPQRPAQSNDASPPADTRANTGADTKAAPGTPDQATSSRGTQADSKDTKDAKGKNTDAKRKSSGADDDTVAGNKPRHTNGKAAAKVAGTVQVATFVAPAQVAVAVVPVATTDARTVKGAPAVAALQAADPQGKAGTVTVPKGKAVKKTATDSTATGQKVQPHAAQLAGLGDLKNTGNDPSLDGKLAALAKAGANGVKAGKDAGKDAATPAGATNTAASTNGADNDTTKLANVTVQGSTGTVHGSNSGTASAPLHAQTAHGVLAAQEVGTGATPDGSQEAAHHPGSQPQPGGVNPAAQGGAVHPAAVVRPQAFAAAVNPGVTAQTGVSPNSAPRVTGVDAVNPSATPQATLPNGAPSTQTTAATQAATRAQASEPVPLDEVAVHIARAAAGGTDRINIKLKPAALGTIDVKIQLTHDGRATAVISADHSGTLNMLRRDAHGLQQALTNAGLKADSGSLQFSLQNQNQGQNPFFAGGDDRFSPPPVPSEVSLPAASQAAISATAGYANLRAGSGGLDIRV